MNRRSTTVGHDLTYRLTVENSGPGTATDVRVIDTPDAGVKLISAKPSAGSCGHTVPLTCTIPTLAAGGRVVITVVVRPLSAGALVNTARVETPEPNRAPLGSTFGRASATIRVPVGLTKIALSPTVHAGQRLRYAIVVRNTTDFTAKRVQLCDRLPAGQVFISATVRMTLQNGSRCVTFVSLGAHHDRKVVVTVRVLAGAASGRVLNRAVVSGPDIVTTRVSAPVRVLGGVPASGGVTG